MILESRAVDMFDRMRPSWYQSNMFQWPIE